MLGVSTPCIHQLYGVFQRSMAPFSTSERRKRRPGDRKSIETAMAIKQTLETTVMTHLYPRSQIDIFIQVIQADGGG